MNFKKVAESVLSEIFGIRIELFYNQNNDGFYMYFSDKEGISKKERAVDEAWEINRGRK